MTRLTLPSAYLDASRIEADENGHPVLLGAVYTGTTLDAARFAWQDSAWALSWFLGQGVDYLWPVLSPPGRIDLLWKVTDFNQDDPEYLMLARALSDGVALPESVTLVAPETRRYWASVAGRRRWVIIGDYNLGHKDLRLLYSETRGVWTEIPIDGLGSSGVSVTSVGDSSALIAWASTDERVRAQVVVGNQLVDAPAIFGTGVSGMPCYRPRPSGGQWLAWATSQPWAQVTSWRDGVWEQVRDIACAYADTSKTRFYYAKSMDLSRDAAEYPVIAWSALSGYSGLETICVAVPSDTGWTTAEELANTSEGVLPSVTRDRNEDVWVAFFQFSRSGILWLHTYTRATCSRPFVTQSEDGRLVRWVLSEPAPGTWWSLLRAQGEGPFESVARGRAGSSTDMSWLDESPIGGDASYRVRRDCVDTRYQWVSESSDTTTPARVSLISVEAQPGRVHFSWYSADDVGAAILSRRTAQGPWIELGAPRQEGNGLLTYVDSLVSAGRYAYRLGFGSGDFTPDVWVEVPSGFALALQGLRPNPAAGALKVSFSLATDDSATLEIYSVNGRCLLRREVGSLGAGNHLVDLDRGKDMRPGVYWIRISQSGKSLTTKGVIAD